MQSKRATPHHAARPSHGVTLIEALVALLVMSFGMVALVGLMANLRLGGDIAKQRGEAMRLAQADLADLRSFAVLTRPAGDTTMHAYDRIGPQPASPVTVANSNATFSLERDVTPLVKGSTEPQAETMSVTVTWQDRAGQQGSIKLDSIVSRTDPAFAGATGIAPPTNGVRVPGDRNPAIPSDATDLNDDHKRSAFRPSAGSTTVWVFNNLTGIITSVCTISTDTLLSSLTASVVAGCTKTTAFLVSGTIRFSFTSPANPTTPEAFALPSVSATVNLVPSQFSDPSDKTQLAGNANYAGTPQCFSDAPSGSDTRHAFVNYNCIVYPNGQTTPNWWGQVLLTGLSIGTDTTQFRVCRYSADYNGNGYTFKADAASGYAYLAGTKPRFFLIDNEEHPETYWGVTYSLVRQNFLIVRGDVACPTAPAPDPTHGIFIDYSTVQLQP